MFLRMQKQDYAAELRQINDMRARANGFSRTKKRIP
jgi:hypothetical protein